MTVAFGAARVAGPSARRWVLRLLAASQFLLAISLAWQWLCVSTYRLYLDQRLAPETSASARARQRFEVRDGRVQPEMLTREDERLSFPVDFPWPSQLRLQAVPNGRATIEIAIVQQGTRRTLYRGTLPETAEIAQPLPPTTGLLELANQGELRWADPRLVQERDLVPQLLGLLALLALTGLSAGKGRPRALPRTPWARTALLGGLTAAITASLCLVVLEVGLRAMGDHLPWWVTVQRRNLGEVRTDPRWQGSARYGVRLRPRLRTFCEWRHGDIVRLVFLPSYDRGLLTVPVAGGTLRFAFLPPYLNKLRFSREELEASPGWQLTRRSLLEMDRLVRSQGGELVVLFMPSEAQVYLLLLEASFPPSELQRHLGACLRDLPQPPELAVMRRNRLALNDLMRDFCAAESIASLDLTDALESKVAAGLNVYFPDDSHWNAAGHETAAATLARFMRARGL